MSARTGLCDRAGCTGRAFGRVSVLVFAEGDVKRTRGAKLRTELFVCSRCAGRLSPRDIISDAGWTEICATFVREGRLPPRRDAAQVLVQPVELPAHVPAPRLSPAALPGAIAGLVAPLPRRFQGRRP